jgi:exopolyphosphatase/guanosine-5'-triphosphate,3'-diphosphate pyrophosphatase
MNLSPNYAGIDIGSNAIRLLIANAIESENFIDIKKNLLIRIPIRLGEDVFTTGKIGEQKAKALTEAITGFRYIMKAYNVIDFKACATSAMREAENGADIVALIKREAKIDIQIINGQTEAEIIFADGSAANISKESNYIYVDVGGGSTEITVFCENRKVDSRSFKLGTVRMLNQGVNEKEISEMQSWLRSITDTHKPAAIIGTGGNINKIQKLINKRSKEPLLYNELKKLYDKIKEQSIEDRIIKLKLSENRADVIVPALQIFLTIMKTGNIDEVYVPKVGLADGIVREIYNKVKN